MNKRLLAIAVGGALSGIAAAQAEVTIYGKLYPQFQTVKESGATTSLTGLSNLVSGTGTIAPKHQEVNASSSQMGFKASTDLGGGLKGFMQIEQQVSLDEGGDEFASRSSYVGLSGGFGTVYLGRMDTVYKDLGGAVSFLGVSAGNFVSESNIISKNGMGTRNSGSALFGGSFHKRLNHMVRYETPEIGGVQFLIQHAPDEVKSLTTNRTVTSGGVKWEAGPLYLALAHEIHKDFFGGSTNAAPAVANASTSGVPEPDSHSKDNATRLSWSWELMKGTKIGGDFARLTYKETGGIAGEFEKYEHDTWSLGVAHKMGSITLAANYSNSDEGTCSLVGGAACTTTGLDGNALALGILYSFSKQVGVFGLWSKLENGEAAAYDNLENSSPARGADTSQMAVGVLYRF